MAKARKNLGLGDSGCNGDARWSSRTLRDCYPLPDPGLYHYRTGLYDPRGMQYRMECRFRLANAVNPANDSDGKY